MQRRAEYCRLRAQWTTIGAAQAARFAKWRERRGRVDKDVRRTDRSTPFYAGEDPQGAAAPSMACMCVCVRVVSC